MIRLRTNDSIDETDAAITHDKILYMGGRNEEEDQEKAMDERLADEEKYANQEADWDEAENHRLANMAYKVTEIDLDARDIKRTKVTSQAIPQDEHWFSMWDSNIEFNKLGAPGFPLLFEFN